MRTIIRNGTLYDGELAAPKRADVLIADDGTVEAIGVALAAPDDAEVIDAEGCWVTPGFLDIHTHYDAELEIAPALSESLRHGVTTTLIGSCGLSLVVGEPEDLADTFCRVEGIPREIVLPMLEDIVDWKGPAEYVDHLSSLPLGPNVVGMAGHSTLRTHVLGMERSLDRTVRPDQGELDAMSRLVSEGMEAGLLGMSVNLLPWDKMGGERFRSRPTPSVFARFAEYRRLTEPIRAGDGVFQAIPNLQTRWSFGPILDMSRPRDGRALRTSMLTMMDAPPAMGAYRALGAVASLYNSKLGAHVRFQALPTPFDVYTDGIENPVFEEFGAGTEALHLEDVDARRQLMGAPGYQQMFRKQWTSKVAPRAYHRNLSEARIVSAPDASLDGRTFAEVAAQRGADPLDTFLDLQATYGNDLRWYTVIANANPGHLQSIVSHPAAMIGFSDAGAHLRNMAFYNFPLRMLKRVRDAELAGAPFMSVQQAVHKLTADIADFHRIDAGRLAVGKRADVVVIDPERLDDSVEEVHEQQMVGFGDLDRLVRRNDDTVRAVLVNGRVAWRGGTPAADLGTAKHYGQFLPLGG
ncbi:MAG: amidohydrolase family protein [Candidatus Microthrix sp.]|nr:amidohydrolase family protein [Candidatus Microthrix sp.]